jgi:hypothetical protein
MNGIREGDNPEAKKKGLMDKVRTMHGGLADHITQQQKYAANGHFQRTNHFLTAEYFPEERRDQCT